MLRLVLIILLASVLLTVAVSARDELDRDRQAERDSGEDNSRTRSHRVEVDQLPGMTFTADELSREDHWSGMLPVSGDHSGSSSQLFYWLIKSRFHSADGRTESARQDDDGDSDADGSDDTSDAPPLVIWLNGGPGCSSLGGLLEEHGPFFLERNPNTNSTRRHNSHPYRLVYNRHSWSNYADMMYVDQPVGVGFTHLHNRADLVRTEGEVAEDFYRALTYFLTHHQPHYRHRRIYLSGESYAAKYVPAIAAYILNQNRCLRKNKPALDDRDWAHYNNTFYSLGLPMSCPDDRSASAPSLHMHLSGLLIGNGDYSPLLQRFASRPITLSLGLMDVKQANQYSYLEEILDNDTELYKSAFESCGNLETAVSAFTSGISEEDMRNYKETFSTKLWLAFVNNRDTRRALHLPDDTPLLKADCSELVEAALQVDSMKDIRGLFSFLLNHLRVTVYTGNFDLLDGSWSNEVFLDSLWHWKERARWFLSRRYVWRPLPCSLRVADNSNSSGSSSIAGRHLPSICPPLTDSKADEVYGYSKSYDRLSFVVVAQAGHMVATTQPARAHELFYRFIHDLPYYNPEQREMNDDDAQQVCSVLQCNREGHGRCESDSMDCECDHGWTGTACTIPVWRITGELFRSSLLLRTTTLSAYTHASSLPSQSTHMFYFSLDESTLESLNAADHRQSRRDPQFIRIIAGRQADRLSSAGAATCTFEPPLQLKVVVREKGRTASEPFHLSTSLFWNSYFQNSDSSSAIRFFGDFDPSNLFLGRNLHGDRQSLGPRVLSILTSPSAEHVTVVGLTQCDHYAIKVGNSEGAIDDIQYELQVTVQEAVAGEGQDSLVSQSGHSAAQLWIDLLLSALPWCLFVLAAGMCCWLYVKHPISALNRSTADEATPLLLH